MRTDGGADILHCRQLKGHWHSTVGSQQRRESAHRLVTGLRGASLTHASLCSLPCARFTHTWAKSPPSRWTRPRVRSCRRARTIRGAFNEPRCAMHRSRLPSLAHSLLHDLRTLKPLVRFKGATNTRSSVCLSCPPLAIPCSLPAQRRLRQVALCTQLAHRLGQRVWQCLSLRHGVGRGHPDAGTRSRRRVFGQVVRCSGAFFLSAFSLLGCIANVSSMTGGTGVVRR
jgi:hypothetical protein